MFVLNRKQIIEAIEKQGIISDFINLDKQLTPNGFDVSVRNVYEINGSGSLDFSNKERKFPEFKEIEPIRKSGEEHGWWHLAKGIYKIKTNELFKMPLDMIAIAKTRSSMFRMGAAVFNGVWDAGFEGRAEMLLNVLNEKGIDIKENARVVQMIFFRIDKTEQGYEGIHKNLA